MAISDINSNVNEIKLVSGESALLFTWIISKDSNKLSMSLLLSRSATDGSIFSTNVPVSIHKTLLDNSRKYSLSSQDYSCYIVSCNSGEVFLVDTYDGGSSTKICNSNGSIVWANFMTISDQKCLCLLERIGHLRIGMFITPNTNNYQNGPHTFFWKSLTLSISPICCGHVESSLIMSDGHASFLCRLTQNLKTLDWEHKEIEMPFWGVFKIIIKGAEILMTTCDGRLYKKTLLELDYIAGTERPDEIPIPINNLSLSDVMTATKRCSAVIQIERSRLDDINLYMEQISIAHILLSNLPNDILKVEFKLEPSLEKEGFYLLLLDISFESQNFQFKGPWWQLSIKLNDLPTCNCIYNNFNELFSTSKKTRFHFYIPPLALEKLVQIDSNYSLQILFDVVFCHFISKCPILVVNIHQETLDLLHFLNLQRNGDLYDFPFPCFKQSIDKMFLNASSISSQNRHNNASNHTLLSCQNKESIILFEKHLPIILSILPDLTNPNLSLLTTVFWLQNIAITISCQKTLTGTFEINLESSSKTLVRAVKNTIERRALRNYKTIASKVENINLPSDVLRKANVCKLLLDLETSNNPSEPVIKRLFSSITELISSIPL